MLTHARMRDVIAQRTGYPPDVVAHVLDQLEATVLEELLQQGEVIFRGLFRVVPRKQSFPNHPQAATGRVERITLAVRPTRALRKKLSAVLPAR